MRPSSIMGDTGAISAVRGEMILYSSSNPQKNNYTCIGTASVNGHAVTFWASSQPGNYPIIIVDGVVVAQSENIPYLYDRPLQIAIQESCREGILFPVDGESAPLYWDVGKLISSVGSSDYFSAFNVDTVSVGLNMPANFPVLDQDRGLVDLGGPVGMPVGKYKYSVAYEDASGNRTNWGLDTPWISIPNIQKSTDVYARTVGGVAAPLVKTNWGIPLLFRVDNQIGYSTLVFRRDKVNDGSGLTGVVISEIVARISITPGQFVGISFVDPVDSNAAELIPTDETAQTYLNINSAKSVEYADSRLVYGNIKGYPQDLGLTYRSSGGVTMFPFTKSLVDVNGDPAGYENAYSNTYYKRYQADRYSFGIQPWNGQFGTGFAQDMQSNFQFPNRRDEKKDDSLKYSDDPLYNANNDTQGTNPVTPTFEAFKQGTKRKDDFYNFVNVNGPNSNVYRPYSAFTQYNPIIPPGVSTNGSNVSPDGTGESYRPWKPLENGDSDTYNIPPVTARNTGTGNAPVYATNSGNVFNPIHQALGAKIYGVQNIPKFVKAFTVVRTEAAGEVVCQGIGTYDIVRSPDSTPANKSTNSVKFYSPDLQSGMVDQVTIDDIRANPQNYSIRVVSSLGYYTEQYADYPITLGGGPQWSATCIDMISYGMFTEDHGQVNVGDNLPMAYQPAAGSDAPAGNYIGLGKWRNTSIGSYSFWHQAGNDGNSLLTIDGFTPITEGRGGHWRITTDQYIYDPAGNSVQSGVSVHSAFNDPIVRRFSQPWYVINIIRNGATVSDSNTTPYLSTYTHIKLSSAIGIYGSGVQDFRILDERWEDCTPEFGDEFRYAYVQGTGAEQIYASLDNNYFGNLVNLTSALTDISTNGFWLSPNGKQVTGFYRQVQPGAFGDPSAKYLRFGEYLPPPTGSRIVVKYDDTAPISVFGGDSTVSPSVFGLFDRLGSGDDESGLFELGGLPLPYAGYQQNPRWFLPNGGQETQQVTNLDEMGSLRQWVIMASIEGKTPCALDVSLDSLVGAREDTHQRFPHIHYVIRPMHGLPFGSGSGAGFLPQYDNDCPEESVIFAYGGLRYLPDYNLDYARGEDVKFFGFPETGYVDPDYCTTLAASDQHNPTSQASPGLRTFRTDGTKAISDDQGEIKRIAIANAGGSTDFLAWTQKGLCKVLFNKSILTGADGSTIALQSIDTIWGEEIWIKKNTMGLPDEFWRLWSRGVAPVGASYQDTFYWPDRKGWYRMTGDSPTDISREKYLSVLLPRLKTLPTDFTPQMSAYYNETHKEMWASISAMPPDGLPGALANEANLYVYSALTGEWLGQFTYRFDEYLCHEGNVLGMRGLETFTLDQGYLINGDVRTSTVTTPFVGELGKYKEAVRWRVVGTKPDQVDVQDAKGVTMIVTNEALNGTYWTKLYDSWEQNIGRTSSDYDPDRKRAQDVFFFQKVTYNTVGDKEMFSEEQQQENIK